MSVRAEVKPPMNELGVDAMETFQDAVELAGPVMDNVNRAGMHGAMCGSTHGSMCAVVFAAHMIPHTQPHTCVRLCLCVHVCVCDGCRDIAWVQRFCVYMHAHVCTVCMYRYIYNHKHTWLYNIDTTASTYRVY